MTPKITSITLSYHAGEDRIHIALRVEGQRVVCLWITQRLARRLIAVLAAHLEKVEAIPLPNVRTAVMAHAQAQAVSAIKPQPPVVVEANDLVYLVTDIIVRFAAEKMELRFTSAFDCMSSFVLDRTSVRQWLSMIHRQFVAAEWPLDVWPAWLTEGSVQPAAIGTTRH